MPADIIPMIDELRIGCVPYLNAKPLVRHLPASVVFLEPSLLAKEFKRDLFDIALIPVVECLLEKDVRILDGIGIACQGQVYSVVLAHEKPLRDLKSIALDAASLSSVTLLKVLLASHWKIRPDLFPDGHEADAQLLIGDRALKFRRDHPGHQITDLGLAWRSYTGLPFVFAVWAVNPRSKISPEQIGHFRKLSLQGLANREEIAQTPEEYHYLTEWIRFEVGPFEKEAIKRFSQEINGLNLFPDLTASNPEYV